MCVGVLPGRCVCGGAPREVCVGGCSTGGVYVVSTLYSPMPQEISKCMFSVQTFGKDKEKLGLSIYSLLLLP